MRRNELKRRRKAGLQALLGSLKQLQLELFSLHSRNRLGANLIRLLRWLKPFLKSCIQGDRKKLSRVQLCHFQRGGKCNFGTIHHSRRVGTLGLLTKPGNFMQQICVIEVRQSNTMHPPKVRRSSSKNVVNPLDRCFWADAQAEKLCHRIY